MTRLYILLSRTDTGMGRLIRFFTRYDYNHVSLSLDPAFREWVSFARYRIDTPLAGGFVREPAERFFAAGDRVPVKIFQVALTPEQAEKLQTLFALAGKKDSGLIYNTFSALGSVSGHSCPLPGAYTCLDLACAVLEASHSSIRSLDQSLTPHLIFSGELGAVVSDSGDRSGAYFTRRGLFLGTGDTLRHFWQLFLRVFSKNAPDPLRKILSDS